VLAADNTFFLTYSESVDADANDFSNVTIMSARICMCLFCFNCVVNFGAALYASNSCSNSTTILLLFRGSFSRDVMTLRLLRARLPHSKRILMQQSTIKSKFADAFVLLQA
jgi:hypothetical protein